MSKIFVFVITLILTSSCDTNKIIYVAGTFDSCEDNPSQKCLQVKENKEDEWTLLPNNIEGFEYKEGFMQKIEVAISKIKNPPVDGSPFKYKFVRLIYQEPIETKTITVQTLANKWQVNTITGMKSLAKQPTMIFKDGQVSGNAGCNNYSANFTLNGNEINFGLAMATKMMCTNMKIEKAYFNCLTQAKTYKIAEDGLTFYDESNAELMRCNLLEEE